MTDVFREGRTAHVTINSRVGAKKGLIDCAARPVCPPPVPEVASPYRPTTILGFLR